MPLSEPRWWYGTEQDERPVSTLEPLAQIYARAAIGRFSKSTPYRSRLPVICVGNFTAGGTGKTPLSIAIANKLQARGEQPVFLTRGYGGRLKGPAFIDPAVHTARDVGDEPLLLAAAAPTILSANRKAGARFIETTLTRASMIIMDDGLQNPGLAKDVTIAVIDGRRGLGNRQVIPAGPLRAPLDFQLGLTDMIVINQPPGALAKQEDCEPNASDEKPADTNGQQADFAHQAGAKNLTEVFDKMRRTFPGPVLAAHAQPTTSTAWLEQTSVIAFAGIGNPERFFDLLENLGARITERIVFADHRAYTEADANRLLTAQENRDAVLVTTQKDLVRLAGQGGNRAKLANATKTLPIELTFSPSDDDRLESLLDTVAKTGGYRAGLIQP